MQNNLKNLYLLLVITLLSCEEKKDINCGYNGETIMTIKNQNAFIKKVDDRFFLQFKQGLETPSQHLLDTIYSLLPCNLPDQYKIHDQSVEVSGEIKENPGYSSHNNYTDFYINKISKN